MIRRLDEHPDFESEAVSRARGRLMRLALEVPPRAVFALLRHAEDAARQARSQGQPR